MPETKEATKGLTDLHFSFRWRIPKDTGKVLASGQCVLNASYVLQGLFVKTGRKGEFVTIKADKGKDPKTGEDKWYEHHHPITADAYARFQAEGLEAYHNESKNPTERVAPKADNPAHPDDDADPSMI